MQVKMSSYLKDVKPIARKLVDRLLETYAYVSLLGADSVGKKYTFKRTGVELDDSMWSERGFVIRVHNGKNYSEYSFNQLTEDKIEELVERVHEVATNMNELMGAVDVPIKDYAILEEEAVTSSFLSEVEIEPTGMSHDEILAQMEEIMNKTLASNEELVDARIVYEAVQVSKIFLSKERDLEQSYVWSNGYVIPIGVREGNMKYCFHVVSGLHGPEILNDVEAGFEKAVTSLDMLLGSEPIEAGEYDVILDPEMSGLVAHEAFGHGVEMDMFVKERAKAAEYIDQEVASSKVNMFDGAKSAVDVSSYLFDDEGQMGSDTQIIEDGVLRSGISDVLSALTLGTKPTGNGKRQNYEHKAYTRMTNTFFAPGKDKLSDMMASIDYGFLLESYSSGMEDPKNWGIQCVVSRAREIKNGELTGKVFSPVFLTGYVPELLKSMTMVSDDMELTGGGMCGKGHKEYVKTSSGGPFIKARGRLS